MEQIAPPDPVESVSKANIKLRRVKRDLVLDLFLQSGTFWGYVQRVRTAADITPAVQMPKPVDTNAHYPPSWEQAGKAEKQVLKGAWLDLILALRNELIPNIYWLSSSPVNWVTFLSACLL